jgi:hypothetical protein
VAQEVIRRDFRIQIASYAKSDLLIAYSDDLPGLLVTARSEEELARRVPLMARQILEAEGTTLIDVELEREPPSLPAGLTPFRFTAHASLAAV